MLKSKCFFFVAKKTPIHHANGDNQFFCSQEGESRREILPVIAKVSRTFLRKGLLLVELPETGQLYTELYISTGCPTLEIAQLFG